MRFKIPILSSAMNTLSRWAAEIRSIEFLTESEFVWSSWEPTVDALAPLTITRRQILRARYMIKGNIAVILCRINVVTGGVAASTIYLPLPTKFPLVNQLHSGWGNWGVGGVAQGLVVDQSSQARLSLSRSDGVNWAAGTTYGINVGAVFELM